MKTEQCAYCECSRKSAVHNDINRLAYHRFVEPDSESIEVNILRKLKELENRIERLEAEKFQEN